MTVEIPSEEMLRAAEEFDKSKASKANKLKASRSNGIKLAVKKILEQRLQGYQTKLEETSGKAKDLLERRIELMRQRLDELDKGEDYTKIIRILRDKKRKIDQRIRLKSKQPGLEAESEKFAEMIKVLAGDRIEEGQKKTPEKEDNEKESGKQERKREKRKAAKEAKRKAKIAEAEVAEAEVAEAEVAEAEVAEAEVAKEEPKAKTPSSAKVTEGKPEDKQPAVTPAANHSGTGSQQGEEAKPEKPKTEEKPTAPVDKEMESDYTDKEYIADVEEQVGGPLLVSEKKALVGMPFFDLDRCDPYDFVPRMEDFGSQDPESKKRLREKIKNKKRRVDKDMEWVREREKEFKGKDIRAEFFEGIFSKLSDESKWFGEAAVIRTSRYDDIANGVDHVLEWKITEEGKPDRILRLAVDVTISADYEEFRERIRKIGKGIENKRLASLKYLISSYDVKAQISDPTAPIPQTILYVDREKIEEILKLMASSDRHNLKKFPYQIFFIEQMVGVLNYGLEHAKNVGAGDEVESKINEVLDRLRGILEDKKNYPQLLKVTEKVPNSIRRALSPEWVSKFG